MESEIQSHRNVLVTTNPGCPMVSPANLSGPPQPGMTPLCRPPNLAIRAGTVSALVLWLGVTVGRASTIVVNDSADTLHSPGCATTGLGTCSLRDAILFANATPGADTISFAIGIGLKTIMPSTALPDISDAVVIDGTTQPGFAGSPLIELDGGQIGGTSSEGLRVTAGGCIIRGLIINNFPGNGISLQGTGENVVAGNFIGTNASGTSAKPNAGHGISVFDGSNTIGGPTSADRNLIAGNVGDGIHFNSGANVVQGNFIGTDQTGTTKIGNQNGIYVSIASGNVVGGPTASAGTPPGNLISGNRSAGVQAFAFSGSDMAQTFVMGNLIGTDASGRMPLGNQGDGILLAGARSSVIGGSQPQHRNVISGNQSGVHITNSGLQGSLENVVKGNYIGTDILGTSSVGNLSSGVVLGISRRNIVGGTQPGEGNLISGNGGSGVEAGQAGSGTENRIIGNLIGTDASGTLPLPNGCAGVRVQGTSNAVGEPGAGNAIAFNGCAGVLGLGLGNAIRGNSIFSNSGLGIDDGSGIYSNDPCDLDLEQNFPVLTSAISGAFRTRVRGTLNSLSSANFVLDFYSSVACDPSGYGEGQRYLGSTEVTTGSDCNSSFDVSLPSQTSIGEVVTAIAIDEFNTSSEFSACVNVQGSQFNTVTPCRVIDTRNPDGPTGGPPLAGGDSRTFAITNFCGIPPDASSVSVNATITGPTTQGHLTLYPAGTSPPLTSTINYRAGQTRANNAVLALGAAGDFTVSCAGSGTVDFILDVNGYFR